VAERWLHAVSAPLAVIVDSRKAPETRLRLWFETLVKVKRKKVLEDPELFAMYHAVAQAAHGVVQGHVAELRRQLAVIVADGVAKGDFKVTQAEVAAVVIFDATLRFHHPAFVADNVGTEADRQLTLVLDLMVAGLKAGVV
jgi:hypothetical protein